MPLTKTSELEGAALDWAVAKANYGDNMNAVMNHPAVANIPYTPSTDWVQGGPIIERENISTKAQQPDWAAYIAICDGMTDRVLPGPTPLIAAMRCYVASKLGDTVEIPEELL
jgi:hypothetical protein